MQFHATPFLSDGLTTRELGDILALAQKAIDTCGGDCCCFDFNGQPNPAGIYEVWASADRTHFIVSYS